MALAIDTTPLAEHCVPQVQRDLDKLDGNTVMRRFQIQRLCAHATVIHDAASTARRLSEGGDLKVAKQEALDWQADQDEDQDELEVFQHLRQQALSSPLFDEVFAQTNRLNATTTIVASCAGAMSPSLAVDRPLSSFHRYSLRTSFLAFYDAGYDGHHVPRFYGAGHGYPNVIPYYAVNYSKWVITSAPFLRIVGASNSQLCVVWHLQCDVVDLLNRLKAYPSSRPGKRRRAAVNPLLSLEEDPSMRNYSAEKNVRFNGVRYRSNRRTWVAEMKPPGSRNKVSFGDFKTAAQAARVVDAAFHHYDKPALLNFPDYSPRILSTRAAPRIPLNEEDKLRFVKEEAKWLASIANSTLPAVPSLPSELEIYARVDPSRWGSSSSVQITEGWDGANINSSPVVQNFANPSSQPCERMIQGTWMNSFDMSPPAPMLPVPPSPSHFQDEVARSLLEQQ